MLKHRILGLLPATSQDCALALWNVALRRPTLYKATVNGKTIELVGDGATVAGCTVTVAPWIANSSGGTTAIRISPPER